MNKQTLFLFLVFLLAAIISWPLYFNNYAAPDTVSIHEFPMMIADWTAEEIPISDHDYSILETRNAFTRMYTRPDGGQVLLYIIYAQHNRKVAHPPEICYTGGGATIITKDVYAAPSGQAGKSIPVNKVFLDNDYHQQIMYYVFKVGGSFTPSYWRQQVLIGLKTLLRQPASSAMIRLTTVIENDNSDAAIALMNDFAADVFPLIPRYIP